MRFALAPLAGFTDAPFRMLCRECGADICYGEMVSAEGLAHGSAPTWHMTETMPGEGPVAMQVFGADESSLAKATKALDDSIARTGGNVVEINLNAGCPVPKVVRSGAGAKLVHDPAKIGRLLAAMRENTALPVTLKTRLGPHPRDTRIFEIVDAAEHAGASGVIVHARYTSQMHGGDVHLDTLAETVARSHIPVTGNGSVVDAKTASEMAATGVVAIMVGRAALSRPGVFTALKGKADGATDPHALARRHLDLLLEFRQLLAKRHPGERIMDADAMASLKMRTHMFRYFSGMPGAAALRARMNGVRTLADVLDLLA